MSSRRFQALVALVVGLIVIGLPRIALACPQCAGRSESGYAKAFLIGGFMAFPFAVVYLVIRIIKKLPPSAGPGPAERGDIEG